MSANDGMEGSNDHGISGQAATATSTKRKIPTSDRSGKRSKLKHVVSKSPIEIRKPNWLKDKDRLKQAVHFPVASGRLGNHPDSSIEPGESV